MDLRAAGFEIDFQWYANIFDPARYPVFAEAPGTHSLAFLKPLARFARGKFVLDRIEPDADDNGVRFRLNGREHRVTFPEGDLPDFDLVSMLVEATNRALESENAKHHFALAVVTEEGVVRFRGLLLPEGLLATLADDPEIRIPADRASWSTKPQVSDAIPSVQTADEIVRGRVYRDDAESIDGPSDLERVVEAIAALGDETSSDTIECTIDGAQYELAIGRGDRQWRRAFPRDGWLDPPRLVAFLNEVLADRAVVSRFVALKTDDQSFAIAYATPEQCVALLDADYVAA